MADTSMDDLRYYLRAWSRWVRAWRAPLGIPSCVSMVEQMLPTIDGWSDHEDINESIEGHVMRAIDSEVEKLPILHKAALRLTYLNETLPAVFRSNRLSREDAKRLCQIAEQDLIPKLRLRGVVLGRI